MGGLGLAETILQAAVSPSLPQLEQIVLRSDLHTDNKPEDQWDRERLHIPMTKKKYQDLRAECRGAGVTLSCCCYQSCFQNIASSTKVLNHLSALPPDVAIDEAAVLESQRMMQGGGLRSMMMRLDSMRRGPFFVMQG